MAFVLAAWLGGTTGAWGQAAPSATVPTIAIGEPGMEGQVVVDDRPGPVGLATSPTGQTLLVLRRRDRDVLGVDLEDPTKRWTAVPATTGGEPMALGVIDSSTLALLVREEETWSILVHRLPAPGTAGAAAPVQTVKIGTASGTGDGTPAILVSPARDWLAVTGLPPALPKIVRLTITGARLGSPSERRCPPLVDRPSAVTVGNGGEWGLFMPPPRDAADPSTLFTWVSPSGAQRLLQLDSGLERVTAAACCRETGLLWALAVGAAGSGPEGLWRVDAAYVEGRQVARAVGIAALPSPTGLVCLPNGAVAVSHGTESSRIVRFTPQGGGPKEPLR